MIAIPTALPVALIALALFSPALHAETFTEPFNDPLEEGWSWAGSKKENRSLGARKLKIKIGTGNYFGAENDMENLLLRDPLTRGDENGQEVHEVEVTLRARGGGTHAGLVLQRGVSDGVAVIAMQAGRESFVALMVEEGDKTRMVERHKCSTLNLRIRLTRKGNSVRPAYYDVLKRQWKNMKAVEMKGAANSQIGLISGKGAEKGSDTAIFTAFSSKRTSTGAATIGL